MFVCCDEIVSLINDGHTISYVHRELLANGKITIRYSHFHDLLKRMRIRPRIIQRIDITIESPAKQYELIPSAEDENESQDKPLFDLKKYGENERL